MTDVPHLAYPFRVIAGQPAVVEQDSDAELIGCVYAALATELGQRAEAPDYGIEDPTFAEATLEELRAAVAEMEPRVALLTDDEWEATVRRIQVTL